MNRGVLTAAAAIMVGCAHAGWESWLKPSLYNVTFDGYASGESLSDKGAEGGSWGKTAIPAGAEAYADGAADARYLRYSTVDDGLVFTPGDVGEKDSKAVMFALQTASCDQLPGLPSDARAAFTVYAPAEGEAAFMGWSATGWQKLALESGTVTPAAGTWYEVSVKLVKEDGGTARVQYRLKVAGGYRPLLTEDGAAWLEAGGGASDDVVKRVEVLGSGGLKSLSGSEPQQGLFVAIAPSFELLCDESTTRHGTGLWSDIPAIYEEGGCYFINVGEGGLPNTFRPTKEGAKGVEVIECAVRFTGSHNDDTVPADTCARVRLVEDPIADYKQPEPNYWFAYLIDGGWVTNRTIQASIATDYMVEVTLNNAKRTVSYRVKEGYGSVGTYQALGAGDIPAGVSGKYTDIYFDGSGLVSRIRATDRTAK